MALVRWDPTAELEGMRSDMSRLLEGFFGNRTATGVGAQRWIPAMDLVETDENLVLRADLPGLSEDDVAIEIKDGVLTVSGERKSEHEEKREGYHRVERAFGSFSRSLTLPDGIDPDQVKATFDRGVLEVRIPRPAEQQPRRVTIEGNGREKS